MSYTQQDIKKSVDNLISKNQAPIVKHYDGYIILAQDEDDFKTKVLKIQCGDTFCFYTIQRVLNLKL